MASPKRIVVLASGSGSNFQTLIDATTNGEIPATIHALIVDRPCQATQRATQHGINAVTLNRRNDASFNAQIMQHVCQPASLIVCAGYLSILHSDFINQFSSRIINIHPSLLPKFGGMGMYGMKVHQAVIAAKETQSGCTVHYVDSGIDTGNIIEQVSVSINASDNAESLQQKVLNEEHRLLPKVVKQLLGDT